MHSRNRILIFKPRASASFASSPSACAQAAPGSKARVVVSPTRRHGATASAQGLKALPLWYMFRSCMGCSSCQESDQPVQAGQRLATVHTRRAILGHAVPGGKGTHTTHIRKDSSTCPEFFCGPFAFWLHGGGFLHSIAHVRWIVRTHATCRDAAAALVFPDCRRSFFMPTTYNILIMGASYGSLLGTKLALAGHTVSLVCLPDEAD